MENLRATCEADLAETLESEFGVPVELVTPNGLTQHYNVLRPTELLKGQVLYFTRAQNPETGEMIIVNEPVVTLRIASLIRQPEPGEKWFIRMPISPRPGSPMHTFVFTPDRAQHGGTDIGFIRIYPQRVTQDGDES